MAIMTRTVFSPFHSVAIVLAVALGAPSESPAGSLGRCLGTFTLGAPRATLAKPGAANTFTAYPLPSEGERQSAMATVSGDFDASSLDAYGWRLVNLHKGLATLEGNPATLRLLYEAPGIPDRRRWDKNKETCRENSAAVRKPAGRCRGV